MFLNSKNISIKSILPQRYPMLMLDKVVSFTDREIQVIPKMERFIKKSGRTSLWMIMEGMGQAAELMWRLKGVDGMCYLAGMDNLEHFTLEFECITDFTIKAEKVKVINNWYQSKTRFYFNIDKYASAQITHYFEL